MGLSVVNALSTWMRAEVHRKPDAFAQEYKVGKPLKQVSEATQKQLNKGDRLTEILKQPQYAPISVEKQVVVLYAGINDYFEKVPVMQVKECEEKLYKFFEAKYSDILKEIKEKKELSPELEERLKSALKDFLSCQIR